jgi:hypothetical protein
MCEKPSESQSWRELVAWPGCHLRLVTVVSSARTLTLASYNRQFDMISTTGTRALG